MAAHTGVKIEGQRDLLFSMDSRSNKSTALDYNVLFEWSRQWQVGTVGGSTGFSVNGDGNSIILDENPYGSSTAIWDVSNQDATSDADGGWNSSAFSIDNTKMYRFSVWIRRKTIGNGSLYLGTYGLNAAGANIGILNRSNIANNTNPYFIATGWNLSVNTWYLLVGHVWPAGSGIGVSHPDSGIFTTSGTKVTSVSDFVWNTTNFKATHRSYLYYSTDITTNQQWYDPRVEIIPTPNSIETKNLAMPVNRLIKSGVGSKWNLRKKITETAGVISLRKVKPTTLGFQFAGNDDDQSIQVPLAENFNELEGTISAWVNPTSYSGSNGIFINRDDTTANSADWLWIGMWSSGSIFYFRLGGGGGDLTVSSASSIIPINTWTHVACTWKSACTATIYTDGVLRASRNISAIPATSPSATGRFGLGHDNGASGSWNGKMDQFRIYGKQLTANQLLKNYQATKNRYV